jgi:phosphate-selective porin OprO/OprP
MKATRTLLLVTLASGLTAGPVCADETNTAQEIEALKQQIDTLESKVRGLERKQEQGADESATRAKDQQIEELDQKLRIFERKQELSAEDAAARAKTAPRITAGPNGFSFASADTNFVLSLKGVLQLDSRTFFKDGGIEGNDGFILRRARPILQGTVFRDFEFLFVPDFGGSTVQIQDAYVGYRFRPELQLRAGKFKSPVGLENLQSDPATSFNERSLATDLVPNRDLGVQLHGDFAGGVVSYAAGIFNGAPDYSGTSANADFDDNKAFAGRLFLQPFRNAADGALQGLGFGVGGSYEGDRAWTNTTSTGLTPGYLTDGQQRFFNYAGGVVGNGPHWRVSPQGYYYCGPASLLAEYVISDQQVRNVNTGRSADLRNRAWEVAGGVVLTGEDARYSGIAPQASFDPLDGHWGAVQLVGRYAELAVDEAAFPAFANPSTSASAARAWAVGLNWYLNRNVRINASFSRTTFVGGTQGAVSGQPENVFFTRMQLAF